MKKELEVVHPMQPEQVTPAKIVKRTV